MSATPTMVPVTSSNVHSVGYDADANELHVQFHSGGHYVYAGVTGDKHSALMSAKSVGSHLHQHIIKAGHQHRQVK